MLIDWLRFSAAFVLLLTPIGLFHGEKVRYRSVSHDWDRHWRQILGLGLHTIDLARAMLGGWLLVDALAVEPGATGLLRHSIVLTHAGVLWTAMSVQAVVCREERALHAPFAFATGLVAAYFAPEVGGFAIAVSAVLVIGARAPAAYFPLLALTLFGTSALFGGRALLLPTTVVALALLIPWLGRFLFSRRLVISYRARRIQDPTRVAMAEPVLRR